MTGYFFDQHYREEAVLGQGMQVHLRCVRPTDKHMLVEGMHKLSDESRYRRFFTAKPTLSDSDLAFLTEVDGVDHFAMGAAVRADGQEYGIGIARFIRLKDQPHMAEPAVVVVDEEQGKGLGHLLFIRLVAAARERGITRFHCEVLARNDSVRGLLEEVPTKHDVEHRGSEDIIEFDLPEVAPDAEDYDEPPGGDPYRRIVRSIHAGRLRLKNNLLSAFTPRKK